MKKQIIFAVSEVNYNINLNISGRKHKVFYQDVKLIQSHSCG